MEPSEGALHNPSMLSQAASVLGAALRDVGSDATASQGLAMGFRVVTAICKDTVRPATRVSYASANGLYPIDERKQLGHVVTVGSGQNRMEGDALTFDD